VEKLCALSAVINSGAAQRAIALREFRTTIATGIADRWFEGIISLKDESALTFKNESPRFPCLQR
jgi:hypothetical protein